MWLVRRRVFAEANIAVNAEDNVLGWELGHGEVGGRDFWGERLDEGVPIFEGPAVLFIVTYGDRRKTRMSVSYMETCWPSTHFLRSDEVQ